MQFFSFLCTGGLYGYCSRQPAKADRVYRLAEIAKRILGACICRKLLKRQKVYKRRRVWEL